MTSYCDAYSFYHDRIEPEYTYMVDAGDDAASALASASASALEQLVMRSLGGDIGSKWNWKLLSDHPDLSLDWWIRNYDRIEKFISKLKYDKNPCLRTTREYFEKYIESSAWEPISGKLYDTGVITDEVLIKDGKCEFKFIQDIQNKVGMNVLNMYRDKLNYKTLNNPYIDEKFILEVGIECFSMFVVLQKCNMGLIHDNWELIFSGYEGFLGSHEIKRIPLSLVLNSIAFDDFDYKRWDMRYLSEIVPYEFVLEHPKIPWVFTYLSQPRPQYSATKSASKC